MKSRVDNMSRILFIGPLPNPVTGQSLACKVFFDELNKSYRVDLININKSSFSSGISSFGRILEVLTFVLKSFRLSRLSKKIYFTVSESLAGNFKDILIYLVCFDKLPHMVVHLHGGAGMRELLKPGNTVLRAVNRFFMSRIGAVVVLGARHVEIFKDIAPLERIHIAPNFAEDSLFVDSDVILKKFNDVQPLRLLFLSNLIPGKGYLELVEAYKALGVETRQKVKIDFAGGFQSDEHKKAFLESIEQFPGLHYYGVVQGEQKIGLFRNAHLFCLPTYYPYEGQPISILEAYASGCAVLTTDHSGIFDVFTENRNGYCVEKRSADSIRNAINQAVNDPSALCKMALTNRREADELYRTDTFNARLLGIVEGLL